MHVYTSECCRTPIYMYACVCCLVLMAAGSFRCTLSHPARLDGQLPDFFNYFIYTI